MTAQWLADMQAGTRYAYIIYPPQAPTTRRTVGSSRLHNDWLLGIRRAARRASTTCCQLTTIDIPEMGVGNKTHEDLVGLGQVWQSSTYLVHSPKSVP